MKTGPKSKYALFCPSSPTLALHYGSEWVKIKKERMHFKILEPYGKFKRISIDISIPAIVYNSNSKLLLKKKFTDRPNPKNQKLVFFQSLVVFSVTE